MIPVHPGRILKRELAARDLSANKLALALRVPSGRVTSILNGKRAISPDTGDPARPLPHLLHEVMTAKIRVYDLETHEATKGTS